MSYGYSKRVAELNALADQNNKGVLFGKFCIDQDIPVTHVSKALGVSRQTIYNWFTGVTSPGPATLEKISAFKAEYP